MEEVVTAGKRAMLPCAAPLSTAQTTDLMFRMGASFTGMKVLSQVLRQTGHCGVLGKLNQVRDLVDSRIGKCYKQEFVDMVAGGKNEGEKCEAHLFASCTWEAMAIDLDLAAANGTLLQESPLLHRVPGDGVIEFISSYDKGGNVVRLNHRCLGVHDKSQSFKRVTTLGIYEPKYPLQKLMPAENYVPISASWWPRVRLWKTANIAMVVCLGIAKGAAHVVIPKQCTWASGSDPPSSQGSTEDLAQLQAHRRGDRHLPVVDEEAAVRSAEARSAVLILNGVLVEGIRVNLPSGSHLYLHFVKVCLRRRLECGL
jgi:hypothetical protein